MTKVIVLFIGAAVLCHGRPSPERSLHVVYSKMLSEVGTFQAEPRSGVAYVYSITASESPSLIEPASSRSSETLNQGSNVKGFSKETLAAPKVLPFKDHASSKQDKEKKTPFLSIDPLDPKVNESGIS